MILPDDLIMQQELADAIQLAVSTNSDVTAALDELNLQPTRGAYKLAASAFVTVILAHELGATRKKEGPA